MYTFQIVQETALFVQRFSRSNVSHLFFQYLDCLWSQIQKLKKDRWQERHILRPYLAFDSVLCEALQHNLPPFTPPPHTEDSVYPMPRVIFRMFDYTDDPEVRDCYREWWVGFTVRFPGWKCDVLSPRTMSGWKANSSFALPFAWVCCLLPSLAGLSFLQWRKPWVCILSTLWLYCSLAQLWFFFPGCMVLACPVTPQSKGRSRCSVNLESCSLILFLSLLVMSPNSHLFKT